MGDYRVDLVGLDQLIDAAATLETEIEQQVTAIDQRVDALHVNWSGDSAVAHRAAHDERIAGVAEMRTALSDLRAKLKTAHDAYVQVGKTNAEMWP
ncbi:WXG100 family type VII secretion target [Nocardia sp. NPDC051030]|uniref:WXG100 family type VII secretion target n=1 Tax=Nocardia sp. NPDC051030 TaxID=3155162 RepID=UPI0034318132